MYDQFKKILGQYVCAISSGIMIMFLIIPVYMEKVGTPNPTNDLLSAILGIIVALLSIAFPITVGNISERLSAYNNSHIANLFQEESCNKQMKWIIWILILAIISFYFIKSDNKPTNIQLILASFVVLLGIISICIFRKFITRSTQYMIDTDNVVFEYCKQKLKNINNQDKAAQETLLDILRMCGQIILKKEKSQSYIGIKEMCSFMTQIIKNIFDDIKISGNEEILILRNITINYYDITFSIWRNSYKDSPETARMITDDYQEVVHFAINTQKEIMAFEPLFFFYQRISNEISLDDARKLPFCKEIPWLWYFNIVFNENFDLEKLQRANMYLLTVIRTAIDNNNDYVFNAFIANTVDGMWGINELNYPHGLDEETSRKLFEVRYKITNTYVYKDFNSLKELINNISDEQTQKNTYTFTAKCFKYNNIQFLVALIGAYCLYRKKNEYIKYIIYYNQPSFTRTIFVNKDIIPHNIQILINWFCNTSRLLMDYYFIWPDHIDLTYWFKKYMAILLCRICMLTDSNLNFDISRNDSKQYLEYLLFSIGELEEIVNDDNLMSLYENKEEAMSSKSKALSILASIIQRINERKEQIETTQVLSNEKINRFKKNVIQSIRNGSIWYNVLQCCIGNEDCTEYKEQPINYKVIIDKSFLSENDNGIYIGFNNGLSINIINKNRFLF